MVETRRDTQHARLRFGMQPQAPVFMVAVGVADQRVEHHVAGQVGQDRVGRVLLEQPANRGIDVFMADRSVDGPAIDHPRFHFEKI